jgi:pimeloyl-ACP methyl ester carboxylesterase
MTAHALAFLDGLELKVCDVLGFPLGGMVAQQMVQDRPTVFRRMILVGTGRAAAKTSCIWKSPCLQSTSPTRRSRATRCCRRFSSHQHKPARLQEPLSSKGSCSVSKIANRFPDQK